MHFNSGDPAIPITDLDFHNAGSASDEDYHWLLEEYNWKDTAAGYFMEMEADQTSAFISGFGAMPNCHMRLKNIAESTNEYDTVGITRSDPGIGAFTGYHNRKTTALNDIRAGQEVGCIMWRILLTYYTHLTAFHLLQLFVNYGPAWFLSRESYVSIAIHISLLILID